MYKVCVQSAPNLLSLDISTIDTLVGSAAHDYTSLQHKYLSLPLHLPPLSHNSSNVVDCRCSSAAAHHSRDAVVQRGHRDGHHLLLHPPWSSRPASYLPGSHLHAVGCLLPTGLHLPVHAHGPEQIRPWYRRHLLIPLAHGLHLRRARLQRAELLLQRAPVRRLQQEKGQRGFHLPGILLHLRRDVPRDRLPFGVPSRECARAREECPRRCACHYYYGGLGACVVIAKWLSTAGMIG